MLHWLHQKLINGSDSFKNILYLSVLAHCFLCIVLFGMYRLGPDLNFTVEARHPAAIVKLLPLGAKKPSYGSKKKFTQVAKVEKKVAKKTPKKEMQNKKKTALVKEKKIKQKNKKKHNKSKKEIISNPIEEIKTEEIAIQKEEPVVEQKKESEQEEVIEIPVPAQSPSPDVQKSDSQPLLEQLQGEQDDCMYVTQKELQALQLQQCLQDALQEVWIAPVGIPEDVVTEIIITVGWDGALVERTVVVSSEIYIYDKAVQDALDTIVIPELLWGKSIAISFKP